MEFANPNITALAVEATEFPDLARRYQVNGVPKTVVNDAIEILGALPGCVRPAGALDVRLSSVNADSARELSLENVQLSSVNSHYPVS